MSKDKYVHKEGRGSLFKNNFKEKDTQPDLKGTMKGLDGKEYEVAAWYGKTKAGDDMISFEQSLPYEKEDTSSQTPPKQEVKKEEKEDGLPF